MSVGLLLAFASYVFASSITPGPNNAMLLASGANFGFWRTLPHIAGVSLGCVIMLLLVGLGLGQLFSTLPLLYVVLRYAGAAYLLWLAWHIACAAPVAAQQRQGRPITFWQAAAFQWVNPKAWVMIVGAVSTYTPREGFSRNVVVLAVLLGLINAPCVGVWAGFGTAIQPLLSRPGRMRAFNVTMALLLVLSLLPLLQN